jgi:hypothetical protein
MDTNRISAIFTLTEQQAVLAAIAIIYEKLSFLVGLTPEQRRGHPKRRTDASLSGY